MRERTLKGVEGDWFDFTDQWRGYYYRLTHEIGTYKMQYMPVGYIHRTGLDALLPKFGLGNLTEEERSMLNTAWHRLDPWRGRRAMRISVSSWATTEADIDRCLDAVDTAHRRTIGTLSGAS